MHAVHAAPPAPQVSNEDAIRFYQRAGFQNAGVVENYYRRIDPPHAVLLRKVLRQGAAEAGAGVTAGGAGAAAAGGGGAAT